MIGCFEADNNVSLCCCCSSRCYFQKPPHLCFQFHCCIFETPCAAFWGSPLITLNWKYLNGGCAALTSLSAGGKWYQSLGEDFKSLHLPLQEKQNEWKTCWFYFLIVIVCSRSDLLSDYSLTGWDFVSFNQVLRRLLKWTTFYYEQEHKTKMVITGKRSLTLSDFLFSSFTGR